MNLIEQLHHNFCAYLIKTFGVTQEQAQTATFTLNVDEAKEAFGDISTNAAMILAKQLKRNPIEIAKIITAEFTHAHIAKIEPAGPGFLNIFLTVHAFQHITHELITHKENFFKPENLSAQNINIEFVSANPTGPLHFGHGRGGIIGDVLGNILRFLGHQVTKEFYINDAGAQITKLGMSLRIRCQQASGMHHLELPEDAYHGEYLIEIAQQCIAEYGAEVLDKPNEFFSDYAKIQLLERIKQTLAKFGIKFNVWFSEKTLHDQGLIADALEILSKNGHLYEHEGALWFRSTTFGDDKDRVVRKASGELTYVAADVAYLKNKIDRGFNRLFMTLGHDHHSYVVRLHAVQQGLGLGQYPLDIILYQLVKIKEGDQQVRMSKRAGNMVVLNDVIDTVGTDVARFFYLNRKADAQLEFDLELALKKTEENPVYYVQYAYVRTKSILAKAAQEKALQTITHEDIAHIGHAEAMLLKKIVSLKTLLADIANHTQTHLLTYFAIELATVFHRYYSKNRVIDLENPAISRARLLLIGQLQDTFAMVLDLIGISKPERM
jgi:arginyl-tRNA synthetase